MSYISPPRLQSGDLVEVIAPSASLSRIPEDEQARAHHILSQLGLRVRFSSHARLSDGFYASPIEGRLKDFHAAFADPEVKAILPVTGGYNANDLLPYIDWELVKNNPKILCGFSDITTLTTAISVACGFVTYAGPVYASFGAFTGIDEVVDSFYNATFTSDPYSLPSSRAWSDSRKSTELFLNPGAVVLNEGTAEGQLWGGNLLTFNLLQGSKFFPSLQDAILFLEDDDAEHFARIARGFRALSLQPGFSQIKGLLIGRWQRGSSMTDELLRHLLLDQLGLRHIPIITGLDFGHTVPLLTLPVGGTVRIDAQATGSRIQILTH
ncbi:MAG TPA: S66 peptidase family protein [Patescibacteria group bacterium]